MKSKLETRTQMERSYNDEIDNLKIALRREKEKLDNYINTEHQSEISNLKKQVCTHYSRIIFAKDFSVKSRGNVLL